MNTILKKLYEQNLEYMSEASKYLEKAPNGHLSIHRKNGHVYYYQKETDDKGKEQAVYLNKSQKDVIQALAQKGYYLKIKNKVEKELPLLKRLIESSNTSIDDLYNNLPDEKKCLITPVDLTISQKLKMWQNEPATTFEDYPEGLRFHTQRGEVVRSKSELMIADFLYRHADEVDYRYEQELIILDNKEEVILHPDFKVFNYKTGKIIYWEHLGRMDDIRYVNGFMKKINQYSSNGFMIGKDIIMTFEDSYHPLDTLQIKQAFSVLMNA